MDVSIEALRMVKEALKAFKSNIEGISASAVSRSQFCFEECQNKIEETSKIVQELKYKVTQLMRTIQELEQKITSSQNELQQIDRMFLQLEQQLQSLHLQLSELSNRLEVLQVQLSNTEDEYEQQRIQNQISMVQNQINMVRISVCNTEQQIRQTKDKKFNLQENINDYSAQKSEFENELSVEKKRLNQYQQKLEKLNVAIRNVYEDFNSYIQSVKKFETNSVESVDSKHKIVDECIDIIEDIESVI